MTMIVDPTAVSPLAAAAPDYLTHGPVVPIEFRGKRPVAGVSWKGSAAPTCAAELTSYLGRPNNVALRLDRFLVVDVDGEEGRRSLARLEQQLGELPRAVVQESGGGGLHIFFRIDPARVPKIRSTHPDFSKIDFKVGASHILVMAPSVHKSGGIYVLKGDLADAPPAPDSLIKLLSSRAAPAPRGQSTAAGREGERHTLLIRRGVQLLEQGWGSASIRESLWQYQSGFHVPWTEEEAQSEIDGAMRWLDAKANDLLFPKTATAYDVAAWLTPRIAQTLRRLDNGDWLCRDDNVYRFVTREQVKSHFIELITPALGDFELWIGALADETSQKAARRKLDRFKSLSWTDKAVEAIGGAREFLIRSTDLDPAGVVNFRNGAFTVDGVPAPDAVCTRQMNVNFNPDAADAPMFQAFLSRALSPEVGSTVLDVIGHALLRSENSQYLWVFEGPPMAGKSTLLETVAHVFGGYHVSPNTSLLFDKSLRNGGADEDTFALNGAALALFAEGPEGKALCPRKCKSLTGGDTISARRLYGHLVTFENKAEIILTTNHETPLNVDDDGLKRRVKRVLFKHPIPEGERNRGLRGALRAEGEAIANLLLAHARKVRDQGIKIAAEIEEDTRVYFARQDIFGQFIEERLDLREEGKTLGTALYGEYQRWCGLRGFPHHTHAKFYSQLRQRFSTIVEYTLDGSKAFRGVVVRAA